jgi:GGDEF domain-containing protein
MRRHQPLRVIAELLALSVCLGLVNHFTEARPGFPDLTVNPYVFLTLLVASTYGKYWSFVSLGFSAAMAMGGVPLLGSFAGRPFPDLGPLAAASAVPLGVALAGGYLFGILRDAHYARAQTIREKSRSDAREVALVRKEVEAIHAVNTELEERISRQEDSLTYLYTRIQGLYCLNLGRGLDTILETVSRFSGATQCSIWEHEPTTRSLALASRRGWPTDTPRRATLPDEGTIEGWVVRNNLMFSVRMLLSYDNLKAMDRGRNIITLPIAVGRRIWGVLNVEAMPFEKYNQYTEKLLAVVVALSSPAIERALEYATAVSAAEVNDVTGLPSFSSFYRMLERSVRHAAVEKSGVCVVVFELANYTALAQTHTQRGVLGLYPKLAETMVGLSNNRATVYHYKEDNQLVVLYPQLDMDGAVLFSLDVLEKVNTGGWTIAGSKAALEVILGYAVLDAQRQKPDDLLRAAESLLDMQKI